MLPVEQNSDDDVIDTSSLPSEPTSVMRSHTSCQDKPSSASSTSVSFCSVCLCCRCTPLCFSLTLRCCTAIHLCQRQPGARQDGCTVHRITRPRPNRSTCPNIHLWEGPYVHQDLRCIMCQTFLSGADRLPCGRKIKTVEQRQRSGHA